MKRCVLRFLLNESTEGEVLSSDGSEFHQVGPMEQNARSPYVTDRVIGTFSSMPAERRPGLALRYWIRSWRYWGAGPCSVLYTSSVTLYCIRDVIGSQWSSRRTGVIWSYISSAHYDTHWRIHGSTCLTPLLCPGRGNEPLFQIRQAQSGWLY